MKKWILALLLLGVVLGCKPKHDGEYTVQGEVKAVDGRIVSVYHDAIPDFVNKKGDTVGMSSMVMSFEMHDNVFHASSMEVGDRIEFTFQVHWNRDPKLVMTEMKPLE